LTLDNLCADADALASDFYFIKEHSETHQNLRKFNNSVKYTLINKFAKPGTWVIDLCSGKGQDIFKYIKAGVSNILFIDSNENNISEIVNRKYINVDGVKKSNYNENYNENYKKDYKKESTGIYVAGLDLNADCKENINKLMERGIPLDKTQTKLVMCNFGIHYLVGSTEAVENITMFINAILASKGRFVFTCLDGEKIFNLLKKKTSWGDGKRYHIKKLYKDTTFTGIEQEIEILLPFTNGGYYKEYLVNLKMVKKAFSIKKIKYEEHNTFEIFTGQDQLDELDKEYLKLLTFCVFYKA
jgi:mRNA capping enzyme